MQRPNYHNRFLATRMSGQTRMASVAFPNQDIKRTVTYIDNRSNQLFQNIPKEVSVQGQSIQSATKSIVVITSPKSDNEKLFTRKPYKVQKSQIVEMSSIHQFRPKQMKDNFVMERQSSQRIMSSQVTQSRQKGKSLSGSPDKQYRIKYDSRMKQSNLAYQTSQFGKLNTNDSEDQESIDDEQAQQRLIYQNYKNSTQVDQIDQFDQDAADQSFEKSSTFSISTTAQGPMILLSPFPNRLPTIFFQYPSICEKMRSLKGAQQLSELEQKKLALSYKIAGQVPYKCVLNAFEAAGFKRWNEDHDDDWNIFWGIGNKGTQRSMNTYQKINHFPGCWNIGRKDNLWINLSKMKRKYPIEYNFIPNTYLLAYDYERFVAQRESASKHKLWIMKPCAAARGKGIRMISKKSKVSKKKNYLIMEYIQRPHLINGFKYDLRVYVLISRLNHFSNLWFFYSFDPLRIYMYNDGLVRFATEQYSVSHKDLSKKYIHLTNFAVNKKSPNFIKNQQTQKDDFGSKWSHQALRKKYIELGLNPTEIFNKVQDVIVKTCIACEPFMLDQNAKSIEHRNNCFELYGFDVIIDQNLQPWVLEVNVCPSLNSASPLDGKIKTSLISDVLHLVGLQVWEKNKKIKPKQSYQINSRNLNDIPLINSQNCNLKLSFDVLHNMSLFLKIFKDWHTIYTTLEEQYRCGNFSCLYPMPKTIAQYARYFEYQRYNNRLIERYFEDGSNWIQSI